jgi:hypothetical protein
MEPWKIPPQSSCCFCLLLAFSLLEPEIDAWPALSKLPSRKFFISS